MGIETEEPIINDASFRHNFTNEGGIEGTTRFLKNITGMWLLEQCRREWEKGRIRILVPGDCGNGAIGTRLYIHGKS